ncbi:hypothetical protein D3C78_549180 [compost metagenome]
MLFRPVLGLLIRPSILSFAWRSLAKAWAFEPPPQERDWIRPIQRRPRSHWPERSAARLTDKARGMVDDRTS